MSGTLKELHKLYLCIILDTLETKNLLLYVIYILTRSVIALKKNFRLYRASQNYVNT